MQGYYAPRLSISKIKALDRIRGGVFVDMVGKVRINKDVFVCSAQFRLILQYAHNLIANR